MHQGCPLKQQLRVQEICLNRWTAWQRLAAAVGLAEGALPLTLDAPSRALLLLMYTSAHQGHCTATFTVSFASVLCRDASKAAFSFTAAVGLAEGALQLTLDAPSRALLLLMYTSAHQGHRTAPFTVSSAPVLRLSEHCALLPASTRLAEGALPLTLDVRSRALLLLMYTTAHQGHRTAT